VSLTVALVYPELLGTYGDRGNGVVLVERARWRGIDAALVEVRAGARLPTAEIYCLGGGEDGPELRAAESLREDGTLVRESERGACVLAVCGGYQILGRTFPAADGRPLPGLGLLDVATEKGHGRRAVGELLALPARDLAPPARAAPPGAPSKGSLPVLTGFENHSGLTRLGPDAAPLARVLSGVGNGDGTEGAVTSGVVGTYLHGPVLARNPALADLLLGLATGSSLAPLDDAEEEALRAERISAVRRGSPRLWRPGFGRDGSTGARRWAAPRQTLRRLGALHRTPSGAGTRGTDGGSVVGPPGQPILGSGRRSPVASKLVSTLRSAARGGSRGDGDPSEGGRDARGAGRS
jgi:CobQ-like glutamine amidotransferase family enzyme